MQSFYSSEIIKAEVFRRRIDYALHFTTLECLPSIIHHGILSWVEQTKLGIRNPDVQSGRWDDNDEAISISVSAIYYKMFKFKERNRQTKGWVILLLNPDILWTCSARFFSENASTSNMKYREAQFNLSSHEAFSEMFWDQPHDSGVLLRTKLGLHDRRPTNEGAEVQVLEPIAPQHIVGAWVEHDDLIEQVATMLEHLPGRPREVRVRPFFNECPEPSDDWPVKSIQIEGQRELAEMHEEFDVEGFGGDAYLSDGVSLTSDGKLSGLWK